MVDNLWAVGAPPRTPLRELTAGEEGLLPPSQEPYPRSRPSVLAASHEKSWARP